MTYTSRQKEMNYIKLSDIREIQKCLLLLMKQIHEICINNKIIYNLYGGTLLGAIRHKGFIPWDDDIDICLPRQDYYRLIEIVQRNYAEKLTVYSAQNPNYAYPFAKIALKYSTLEEHRLRNRYAKCGLYIDLFPFDGYPLDDEKKRKEHEMIIDRYRYKRLFCVSKVELSPVYWKKPFFAYKVIRQKLVDRRGAEYFIKKETEEAERYSFESSKYVACSVTPWYGKDAMLKEQFLDRTLYDFEDTKFFGPKNYDYQLSHMYGDYMIPPAKEERKTIHDYDLFVWNGYLRSEEKK